MANRYFRGEKIVLAGKLKDSGVVTTAYNLVADLYTSFGKLVQSHTMQLDSSTSVYTCNIDTSNLNGAFYVKIKAIGESGDIVISNESINLLIELP